MKPSDMNSKFTKTLSGQDVPEFDSRQKRLMKHSYLNKLLYVLKDTDWSESPIYH